MNDRLRKQWRDPLLTGLTALLAIMLFVAARCRPPGLSTVAGAFVMSGSRIAVVAMLA